MTVDRVTGSLLALFGLFVLWESRVLPLGSLGNPGPAAMPAALAGLLVLLGAGIVVTGAASAPLRALGWGEAGHAAAIVLAGAFAALGLERLGYRVTMAVMVFFLVRVVERRGTLFSLTFAVGLAVASFFLFHTILRVPLPRGPFGV